MNFRRVAQRAGRRFRREIRGQWDGLRFGRIAPADRYRPVASAEAGNDEIAALLRSGRPCLVTRLGGTETTACAYWDRWRRFHLPYPAFVPEQMSALSGFFPPGQAELDRFARRYLDDLGEADLVGVWYIADERELIRGYAPTARLIGLESLDAMIYPEPWTGALEGRRVLVVHPFAESIERQYARRERLFANPRTLPVFELVTMKAVQSIAGTPVPYRTWFDALDAMRAEIDREDFDIALIGAGAYGLPLAAHVKRIGRQAVHTGGVTQMLFGIVGSRWEVYYDERYTSLVNEAWIRPSAEETPPNYRAVEGGAYW